MKRQHIRLTDLPDESLPDALLLADRSSLRETCLAMIQKLPQKYQDVICWRYGLNPRGEFLNAIETARLLGISVSRAHCLTCLAITRLYASSGEALLPYLSDE